MPPVGNDIVDLAAPGNPGKSGDDRFCARVFTVEERVLIAGVPRPDALLWALWAAKEAAYKAVSRGDPSVCSIPRQYRVEINGDSSLFDSERKINRALSPLITGKVITPRGELAIRIERSADWVHALAAGSEVAIGRVVRCVEVPDGGDPSACVRKGLLRKIAQRLGSATGDLSITQDPGGSGAPHVLFRGCLLPVEASLSHDGRFTAFAFDPATLPVPGSAVFSSEVPPSSAGCR